MEAKYPNADERALYGAAICALAVEMPRLISPITPNDDRQIERTGCPRERLSICSSRRTREMSCGSYSPCDASPWSWGVRPYAGIWRIGKKDPANTVRPADGRRLARCKLSRGPGDCLIAHAHVLAPIRFGHEFLEVGIHRAARRHNPDWLVVLDDRRVAIAAFLH